MLHSYVKLLFFGKFEQKVVSDCSFACASWTDKKHWNQVMEKCVQEEGLFGCFVSLNEKISDLHPKRDSKFNFE
jgi:hypothetical protein